MVANCVRTFYTNVPYGERSRVAPMNHGSGEKSRYPDRPRISRVGMAKTGRSGSDELHHRVGQKSGRDREIKSGRMGDDYEIDAGGGCKGITTILEREQ